ncbi:MAG: hypothetical protein AAB628_00800 [Patescibacteria group bacterium]
MNINETPAHAPQQPQEPTLTQESFEEASRITADANRGGQKLIEGSNLVIERARRGGRGTQAEGPIVSEAIKDTPNGSVARLKKVEERLDEIAPQGIIIKSSEATEYDELALELASLKKRLSVDVEVTEKTLPSAYEAALKRLSEKKSVEETAPAEVLEGTPTETPEVVAEGSEMTPEEKEAQIQEILADMTNGVNKRAEEAGATDFVRNVGEKWRTVDAKYKYAISAGLILSGIGFAAIGATAGVAAIAGLGTVMRMLGGAAMFAGFEKFFNNRHEKKLGEKPDMYAKDNNTIKAGALAIILAVALPEILREHIQGAGDSIHTLFGVGTAEASNVSTAVHEVSNVPVGTPWLHAGLHDIPQEKLAELTTVKAGEGIWNPVRGQLAFAHPDWSPAELNAETHKILIENKIINMDGTEIRVHPGAHVVVHPDGTITHNGGAYDYKAPVVEAPVSPSTPSEVVALNPEAFAEKADIDVRHYINETFGNKGFFGFGATTPDNIESITAWNDPQTGFAHHTIAELNAAGKGPMMLEAHRDYGINNEALRERMKNSIILFENSSGVKPDINEKIGDYLKRATTAMYMNQAQK